MAYFDMLLQARVAGQAGADALLPDQSATFTPLEWRVIALARRDDPASAAEPGRIRALLRRLFGFEAGMALADPRLEALRRAAIRYWRSDNAVEHADNDTLIAAGFSLPQIAALSRHVRERFR